MQYDEFIERVQEISGTESFEESVRIVEVVLSTLGEPLYRTERDKLGAQLPKELEGVLFQSQPPENVPMDVDSYGIEEFYKRVSARASVSLSDAEKYSQAVIQTVGEAVSAEQLTDLRDALPDDYSRLFKAGV